MMKAAILILFLISRKHFPSFTIECDVSYTDFLQFRIFHPLLPLLPLFEYFFLFLKIFYYCFLKTQASHMLVLCSVLSKTIIFIFIIFICVSISSLCQGSFLNFVLHITDPIFFIIGSVLFFPQYEFLFCHCTLIFLYSVRIVHIVFFLGLFSYYDLLSLFHKGHIFSHFILHLHYKYKKTTCIYIC